MKASPLSLILLSCSLLWSASADEPRGADRDRDRNRDRRRDSGRIIVYEDAGFRGDSLVLYPGDSIENMSGDTFEHGTKLNDSITSIRVEGDVEIYAYENARFLGEAIRLTESVRDLSGRLVAGSVDVRWNDRISSIRVERRRERDRPGDPDKVIAAAFTDLLAREPAADERKEFRARLADQGWNDRMLRDYLRTSDRYRKPFAEQVVRRAFLEVLEREVDANGLKHYQNLFLNKGWTESDLRDDLRKSEEYRKKHGGH